MLWVKTRYAFGSGGDGTWFCFLPEGAILEFMVFLSSGDSVVALMMFHRGGVRLFGSSHLARVQRKLVRQLML
jgi:hypothetical protein